MNTLPGATLYFFNVFILSGISQGDYIGLILLMVNKMSIKTNFMKYKLIFWVLLSFFCGIITEGHSQEKVPIEAIIVGLDSIRVELKIPGMAAALMQGDSILFEEGFGYA